MRREGGMSDHIRSFVGLLSFAVGFAVCSAAAMAGYSFIPALDPSAVAGDKGTNATGISGNTIVGVYGDAPGMHGFSYNGTSYTTLNDPNATPIGSLKYTAAIGVSGGTIVGYYFNANKIANGFVYSNGTFTTVDDPADTAGLGTEIEGVSGTTLVGFYGSPTTGDKYGFEAVGSVPEPA